MTPEREARWHEAIAKATSDLVIDDYLDTLDDVDEIRQCLIRTRLAASAERQAHEARAIVVDMQKTADGSPRFVLCTPTGDRVELRELAADVFAAMVIGCRDADELGKLLQPGPEAVLSEHARVRERCAALTGDVERLTAEVAALRAVISPQPDETVGSFALNVRGVMALLMANERARLAAAEARLAALDECDVGHDAKCDAFYDDEQPCTCGLARAMPELDAHWRKNAREKRERKL